jgi:hypothetical protein
VRPSTSGVSDLSAAETRLHCTINILWLRA